MAQNLLSLLHLVRFPLFYYSLFSHCIFTDRTLAIYEREGPWDWADTSFLPPLPSPSQPDDSSWVQQPLGQQVAAERSYVSDEAFSAISGARNMLIFSPDMYPVTTPLSQQFREYSASDPGAQDVPEWRSVSDVQERSGSWHGCMFNLLSFEMSTLSLTNLTFSSWYKL